MTVDSKKAQAREIEGRAAVEHFARLGVTKASLFSLLEKYYGVYDAMGDIKLPALGGGRTSPGCVKGCAFCCYPMIVLTPPEAFYVADFIERTRSPEHFTRTVREVRAADAKMRGLKGFERWSKGDPCPLLDPEANACTVYGGRPLACRGLLSSSRPSCEAAFNEREIKPLFNSPFLFQSSDVFVYALAIGLRSVGRPIHRLEMNAALTTIWTTDRAMERWLAGEDVFIAARAPNSEQPLV